jgi:hypothetical protein
MSVFIRSPVPHLDAQGNNFRNAQTRAHRSTPLSSGPEKVSVIFNISFETFKCNLRQYSKMLREHFKHWKQSR